MTQGAKLHLEQRRDERFRVQVRVQFRHDGRLHEALTSDVSFLGLFVVTRAAPAVRQLLRLDLEIPGQLAPLVLHAMVARVDAGDPSTGRPPGIGLRLYGVSDEERRTWSRFISGLRAAERDEREHTRRGPAVSAA